MRPLIDQHFPGTGDDKVRQLLKVGETGGAQASGPGASLDWEAVLDVYKKRHAC